MDQQKSLTREEAERRAAVVAVTGYEISIDLTGLVDGDEWRAVSTVRFGCRQPDSETFIDIVGHVVRAELNGEPIGTGNPGGRLPLAGLRADNVLVVESVQRNTGSRTGVHRSVDPADGLVYVWTSFEPDDARHAWACFDQPDLKAPHTFDVLAPAEWTVTSNTDPARVEDAAGGRRWTFTPTPPLSTYIPVVNAGPFHEVRRERDGFDLGLFCRRSLAQFLDRDADEMFDVTAAGLTFFGERFALPFPQRRYDQVFVPEMGGAMENYGCVTWSDWFVFRAPPSYTDRELRAVVLLHEMAHMWFGDMVTMRWWDDLWLNEAFADWAANWAAERATPFTDAWATFLAGRKLSGYAADAGPTTHPIRQNAPDVATAAAGFDMITYSKGASVLRQLAAYVGEDAFVAGLRSYFAQHAWGNATLADLMGAVAAASGRDLDRWVTGWLDTAGTDALTVTRDGAAAELVATGPDGGDPRPHRVGVGAYAGGAPLERREFAEVELESAAVALPFALQPDDVVLVNDEDLTFAAVVPDQDSLDVLLSRAAALPTALARTLAVATAWQGLFEMRLPTSRFLACATSVLEAETVESVVEPLLYLAERAARLWTGDGARADAQLLVARTAMVLAERGGPVRTAALRTLAATATTDEHFTLLDDAIGDDTDLRWRILLRCSTLGRLDESAVERAVEADPDPDVWVQRLLVHAAAPDPAAKEEAWESAVHHKVPLGMIGALSRVFWQPEQADLVAPYAERLLAILPDLGRTGMLDAMAMASAMFPMVGVGADYLDRLEQTVRHADVSPVVRRSVLTKADELRRMLVARG